MTRKLSVPLLVFICSHACSQITTDQQLLTEANTTLVNNQLSPEIIKIEHAGGFSNGIFKSADGETSNKFRQSIFTASIFPAALIKKRNTQLYMGVGYINQRFSTFTTNNNSSLFSTSITSVFIGTALSARVSHDFFWVNYVQTGLNGTKPFENMGKTLNATVVSKADYKMRRNLNIGLGLAYFTNMGNPLVLPAVTFTYSQPSFVLNLDFPVKTEFEAILAKGKIRPVAGVSYHGGNYYLNNTNQYLYNFGALGYLGVRFKLLDILYLYAAYQTGVYDQYKSGNSHTLTETGTYSGQNQFVISLTVQAAKFIPLLQR